MQSDNSHDASDEQNKKLVSISLADLEKPVQREQDFIDIIVKNPKNIIAYKALGLYYFKQHNYKDAKESLETALKLGSKDKQILKVLEEIEELI